jgi:hypothetical protein
VNPKSAIEAVDPGGFRRVEQDGFLLKSDFPQKALSSIEDNSFLADSFAAGRETSATDDSCISVATDGARSKGPADFSGRLPDHRSATKYLPVDVTMNAWLAPAPEVDDLELVELADEVTGSIQTGKEAR